MPADDTSYVSPYLRLPLRSFEEALRDRAALSRLRERSQARAGFHPSAHNGESSAGELPG